MIILLVTLTGTTDARAAEAPVGLGTAGSYVVIGGQAVTNTGPSLLGGDLAVSPGSAITGFPPGIAGGATHAADAPAAQAQLDVTTAYNDAAGRALTATVAGDLGGSTRVAGVYRSTSTLALTGTVTLDGQNDPDSVFIFQIASGLTTASNSSVSLINGAKACNVFWQVGSSAVLGTGTTFKGTVLALASISVGTGSPIEGRMFARNGQVSLDTNAITLPVCDVPEVPTDETSTSTVTSTSDTEVTDTSVTGTDTSTPVDTNTSATATATATTGSTRTVATTSISGPASTGPSTSGGLTSGPTTGTSSTSSTPTSALVTGYGGPGGGVPGAGGPGGPTPTTPVGLAVTGGNAYTLPLAGLAVLLMISGALALGWARPKPRHRA